MEIIKSYIIAEIAQAHEGSLGLAHSYIDALAKTGVDAIKFQTHIADAESSEYEKFRINFSYEDKSRFDYWKRMEFTMKQWKGLKNHCEELNVDFISSPFSCKAVDLLEKINVKRYKIGSGEINNFLMLKKIIDTKKPIILSTGMSDFKEISDCIEFLSQYQADLSLLHCTTSYPTSPKDWSLYKIKEFENKFNIPIGFSDHSGDPSVCLAARCLGAKILEFHAVFDKSMFGPDSKASLTIDETKQMVKSVRNFEKSLIITKSDKNLRFNDLRKIFGKSIAVNKNLPKGHIIKIGDLESKKPAEMGIDCKFFENVVGKKLKIKKQKWDFLNNSDIE